MFGELHLPCTSLIAGDLFILTLVVVVKTVREVAIVRGGGGAIRSHGWPGGSLRGRFRHRRLGGAGGSGVSLVPKDSSSV